MNGLIVDGLILDWIIVGWTLLKNAYGQLQDIVFRSRKLPRYEPPCKDHDMNPYY